MLMVADKMPQTSKPISVISKLSSPDHHSYMLMVADKMPQTSEPISVISKLECICDGGR